MDVNAQIQAFLTSQGFRANDTNKFIATDFTGSPDKSYTIQGEWTHELDDILWPVEGDQFPTQKENTYIFKVTDKNVLVWFEYCITNPNIESSMSGTIIESSMSGTIIAETLDGSNIGGVKKLMKEMLDKTEPGDSKDMLNDFYSLINDHAKLGLVAFEKTPLFKNIENFLNETVRFMYLPHPFTTQLTCGLTTEVIKIFKKYIELNDSELTPRFLTLYMYFMCGSINRAILIGDQDTKSLYLVKYLDLGDWD